MEDGHAISSFDIIIPSFVIQCENNEIKMLWTIQDDVPSSDVYTQMTCSGGYK